MNIKKAILNYALIILIFSGLTACGGGSDSVAPTPTPPVVVNTPATFSGDSTGSLEAGDTAPLTGTVSVTDPDAGEDAIISQTNAAQTYGSFSIGTDGVWTYVLDNSNSDVMALATGENLTEVISISSVDMTATNITITINAMGGVVGANLDPNLPPSGNFELLDWKLQNYLDEDGNGRSDQVDEEDLANGYENSEFFYTASDGGMVFKVPIAGAKTSTNTSYTRTELREMLRRGDRSYSTQGVGKNNWVFGSAPESDRVAAGGIDGVLMGKLAVNHVTTTGDANQVGRVIFAQIHANDDEPIRFYYRKLPNNTKASIYFAHESRNEPNDIYYEMIGSRSQSQADPSDGIALNEKFSYEINTVGNILTVKLLREGKTDLVETVDMSNSGYDVGGQYMYFKAGAYIQDNTGDDNDYAQVTYYELLNEHN